MSNTANDIKKQYDNLPRGSRMALARDIGYSQVAVSKTVFGYIVNEDVQIKVAIWLSIMGKVRAAPTYRENAEAQGLRKILLKDLVSDAQSFILVRDLIGYLLENYFVKISSLTNQRIYAIIASNFPLEEHIEGESIIGYRIESEDAND